jgi:hypothetical protein
LVEVVSCIDSYYQRHGLGTGSQSFEQPIRHCFARFHGHGCSHSQNQESIWSWCYFVCHTFTLLIHGSWRQVSGNKPVLPSITESLRLAPICRSSSPFLSCINWFMRLLFMGTRFEETVLSVIPVTIVHVSWPHSHEKS